MFVSTASTLTFCSGLANTRSGVVVVVGFSVEEGGVSVVVVDTSVVAGLGKVVIGAVGRGSDDFGAHPGMPRAAPTPIKPLINVLRLSVGVWFGDRSDIIIL